MPFLLNQNIFSVKYVFCSWECMKRYNIDSNSSNMNMISTLIQKFYEYITSKTDSIQIAPPRCMLKSFGGDLSIEQFRNNNKKVIYTIHEYPVIVDNLTIEKRDNFSWIKEDSASNSYQNHLPTSVLTDSKTLKRPDRKQKSSLENSMGLLRV